MNPIIAIVLGAILLLLGTILPNGVELFDYVEPIAIYNLAVTVAQGLGAGLIVGGAALFIKNKAKSNS